MHLTYISSNHLCLRRMVTRFPYDRWGKWGAKTSHNFSNLIIQVQISFSGAFIPCQKFSAADWPSGNLSPTVLCMPYNRHLWMRYTFEPISLSVLLHAYKSSLGNVSLYEWATILVIDRCFYKQQLSELILDSEVRSSETPPFIIHRALNTQAVWSCFLRQNSPCPSFITKWFSFPDSVRMVQALYWYMARDKQNKHNCFSLETVSLLKKTRDVHITRKINNEYQTLSKGPWKEKREMLLSSSNIWDDSKRRKEIVGNGSRSSSNNYCSCH